MTSSQLQAAATPTAQGRQTELGPSIEVFPLICLSFCLYVCPLCNLILLMFKIIMVNSLMCMEFT